MRESGRKDGEKDVRQSRRRIAEKMEVGEYPDLQPMYDRSSMSRIQRWRVFAPCQGQTYAHARAKWNMGSASVAEGEDDVWEGTDVRNPSL